jgi:HD-GYP domain-containing protein (c-di-GMP phosphodiesterase class II)
MKRHKTIGAGLVEKSRALRPLVPIIHHHHEFFNGQGYPDKLKGSQIPIEARIVALADAIEAMSSERPYRKAFDLPAVINEIKRCAGSQFDPLIVEAAIKVLESNAEIQSSDPETPPDLLPAFAPSS